MGPEPGPGQTAPEDIRQLAAEVAGAGQAATRLAAPQFCDLVATDAHGGLPLPKAHHPGNCSRAGILILCF